MGQAMSGAVRVGVIGTGAMGTAHVRTLAQWVPGLELACVYDADTARAAEVGSEVGADVAPSAEALIESPNVDAVVIAAPDPIHEELALSCLAAGKPTLCEKPLAASAEGSRRIIDAETATGRRLIQVGFMRRFDPSYVDLRTAVADGSIGTPRLVHCVHRNPWAHSSATSEGVIFNSMIHELDILPWLLDERLAAVTVVAAPALDGGFEDAQIALLETASGVVVTVEVFVNARYGYDVTCEVVGTEGTARLAAPTGLRVRRDGGDGVVVSKDFFYRFRDAYRIELAAWANDVRRGSITGPTAWDGHLANVAATAGVEALHSGRRVVIEEIDPPELYR